MKAKMKQDYRFSMSGMDIHELKEGDMVEGEIAKDFVKRGVAAKSEAREPAVFNDKGPVVDEPEDMIETVEQAKQVIADQFKEIEGLKVQIRDLTEKVDQLSKPGDESPGDEGAKKPGSK